jgi:hypothetical protein
VATNGLSHGTTLFILKMTALSSFERSLTLYQSLRRNNSEDLNRHLCFCCFGSGPTQRPGYSVYSYCSYVITERNYSKLTHEHTTANLAHLNSLSSVKPLHSIEWRVHTEAIPILLRSMQCPFLNSFLMLSRLVFWVLKRPADIDKVAWHSQTNCSLPARLCGILIWPQNSAGGRKLWK